MGSTFEVAQAAGSNPVPTPAHTIVLTKPANGQAITVQTSSDGSVLIDFSAIANEKITLVHVGEKLVILFDNQATLTLDPFYDAHNIPLQNLTVEVAPGDDLNGSQLHPHFPSLMTNQCCRPPAAMERVGRRVRTFLLPQSMRCRSRVHFRSLDPQRSAISLSRSTWHQSAPVR